MIARYQSVPTVIEAVQWLGPTDDAAPGVVELATAGKVRFTDTGALELRAGADGAQGWVPVPAGHWLVRNPGDPSDVWPVDPSYFAGKYQPVDPVAPEPEVEPEAAT